MEKESLLKKTLVFVGKHPKQTLIAIWVIIAVVFGIWRVNQPFDSMQPIIFWSGLGALSIGGISLRLGKRDGPRKGATIMSWAVVLIGLTLAYFGVRLT